MAMSDLDLQTYIMQSSIATTVFTSLIFFLIVFLYFKGAFKCK